MKLIEYDVVIEKRSLDVGTGKVWVPAGEDPEAFLQALVESGDPIPGLQWSVEDEELSLSDYDKTGWEDDDEEGEEDNGTD